MITNNLPLRVLDVHSDSNHRHLGSVTRSHRFYRYISNVIANIFSKAFLSLFADFSSPLKHP